MAQQLQPVHTAESAARSDELRRLLPHTPVLSTEPKQAYGEILARLMDCLAPRDFMEQLLIKELADCTWEMARYTRVKTLSMERGFREHVRFPAHEARDERTEEGCEPPAEVAQRNSIDEADALALELDHARALEWVIDYHERVNRLLFMTAGRRNSVLEQIEMYRSGIARRLRQASDDIIAGDAAEARPEPLDATPLIPSGPQPQ